jgi:hypothetical protein
VSANGKSSSTIGCRNKRLFAQNDASWNYKFHLETTPEGMRPYWVKETETYCGIEYSVKGGLYVHEGGDISFKYGINCYVYVTFLLEVVQIATRPLSLA